MPSGDPSLASTGSNLPKPPANVQKHKTRSCLETEIKVKADLGTVHIHDRNQPNFSKKEANEAVKP